MSITLWYLAGFASGFLVREVIGWLARAELRRIQPPSRRTAREQDEEVTRLMNQREDALEALQIARGHLARDESTNRENARLTNAIATQQMRYELLSRHARTLANCAELVIDEINALWPLTFSQYPNLWHRITASELAIGSLRFGLGQPQRGAPPVIPGSQYCSRVNDPNGDALEVSEEYSTKDVARRPTLREAKNPPPPEGARPSPTPPPPRWPHTDRSQSPETK